VDLAYVAHSERCALLLDGDGICRWVVPKVDAPDAIVAAARRCIGAQYVATLDRDTPGYMGHEPRIGTNMLFALVANGRVALVRFGPLVAFEELDAPAEASTVETTPKSPASGAEPTSSTSAELEPLANAGAGVPDVDDLITSLTASSRPDLDAGSPAEPAEAAVDARSGEMIPVDVDAPEAPEPLARDERPLAFADVAPDERQLDPPERALDSRGDLDLVTGSSATTSSRDGDSDPFMAETERVPLRPSGFVMKHSPPASAAEDTSREPNEARASVPDDETRRFSRAAGDMPFVELEPNPASPRRGMLPRR